MKLTKLQALAKIKELQNYIEKLPAPITEIKNGDVFQRTDTDGNGQTIGVLRDYEFKYRLTGIYSNLLNCFSNMQGVDSATMISYLNSRNYTKIGTMEVSVAPI
jgi:hypothetical protein